jgi:hypothetical protein
MNIPTGNETKQREGIEDSKGFENQAPAITLPKGGGAIKGIGEKFAANPVTGTGFIIRAHCHQPRPIRLWTATITFLRLRSWEWSLRTRLAVYSSFNNTQNR